MEYLRLKMQKISSHLTEAETAESENDLILSCLSCIIEATEDELFGDAATGLMAYALRESGMVATEDQRSALFMLANIVEVRTEIAEAA